MMNDTNFRQSNPIEYVLQRLMQGLEVETFDVRNAVDQWNNIKKLLELADKI